MRGDRRHPRSSWVGERLGLSNRREALHVPASIGARSRVRTELPAFVAEIRRLFSAAEMHEYLDHLERAKFLAPQEPDLETDDLDEGLDEEPWLENPVMGAEELLRFSRVRQLLQP